MEMIGLRGCSMSEEWRAVPWYEGSYEASDKGRVRSLDRCIFDKNGVKYRLSGILLALNPNSDGYPSVCLSGVTKTVHRLVLEAFVGPCPDGLECCHEDDEPTNNCLSNLRWDTKSENQKDSYRHGRKGHGQKRVRRSDGVEFRNTLLAAKISSVNQGSISHCCNGTHGTKNAGGYSWEYI